MADFLSMHSAREEEVDEDSSAAFRGLLASSFCDL